MLIHAEAANDGAARPSLEETERLETGRQTVAASGTHRQPASSQMISRPGQQLQKGTSQKSSSP
jgi:hypothetical protein